MLASGPGLQSRAKAQADELIAAIAASESVIIATIERQCEALRAGRMLAAKALHTHLCDAARLYLDATRAARASLWTMEQVLPGTQSLLDERRAEFAVLLKSGTCRPGGRTRGCRRGADGCGFLRSAGRGACGESQAAATARPIGAPRAFRARAGLRAARRAGSLRAPACDRAGRPAWGCPRRRCRPECRPACCPSKVP